MYVCICRGVTELRVKAVIESGAGSVEDVARACRAGEDCGSCRVAIQDMIDERSGGPPAMCFSGERAA
ncbi:MAG: (2Fe-2S)-binding protein [Polyangiaceae bacterium]|jgi:bacterioferritin-associated ferredoxin